jgi:hypothetical protein
MMRKVLSRWKRAMPRPAATVTQADVARTIRAAKQAGAERIEVRPDGTISVVLKVSTSTPTSCDDSQPAQQEIIL